MSTDTDDRGIVSIASRHPAGETMDRLEADLRARGFTIFARIDQQKEAEQVGLRLRPTELLLFGNPKAGTLWMQAHPSVALDLPLKALVWQDDDGRVWITFDAPAYLGHRHGLTTDQVTQMEGVRAIFDRAAA
jgi:uncharacterized protein (DUF302 family)